MQNAPQEGICRRFTVLYMVLLRVVMVLINLGTIRQNKES